MAKKSKKDVRGEIKESARRVWLAGLGALSLAEEEGGKVFKKLVKEGEGFESKSRARASKLAGEIDEIRGKAGKAVDRLGAELDERMGSVLQRVGVPTRDEIRSLTRKIEQLAANVDKLKSGRGRARRTKAPGTSPPEA